MNEIIINDDKITIDEHHLYVNGLGYKLPHNCKSNDLTAVNGRIYVGGYEFAGGKFKKNLKSIWHKYF